MNSYERSMQASQSSMEMLNLLLDGHLVGASNMLSNWIKFYLYYSIARNVLFDHLPTSVVGNYSFGKCESLHVKSRDLVVSGDEQIPIVNAHIEGMLPIRSDYYLSSSISNLLHEASDFESDCLFSLLQQSSDARRAIACTGIGLCDETVGLARKIMSRDGISPRFAIYKPKSSLGVLEKRDAFNSDILERYEDIGVLKKDAHLLDTPFTNNRNDNCHISILPCTRYYGFMWVVSSPIVKISRFSDLDDFEWDDDPCGQDDDVNDDPEKSFFVSVDWSFMMGAKCPENMVKLVFI